MTTTMMVTGGAVILAAAWLATSVLRRAPASLRHLIWLAGLGAILALPFLDRSGIHVEVAVPAAWMQRVAMLSPADGDRGVAPVGTVDGTRSQGARARPVADADGTSDVAMSREPEVMARDADAGRIESASAAARSGSMAESRRIFDAGAVVRGVWALGALWLLIATLVQHLRAYRLTIRDVAPASPSTRRRFGRLAAELGVERRVRLVVSTRLRVPATWGIVRPTVVLPSDHVRWSEQTLERVLLHELAHVQRGDCAAYLLGELARAVHWPNPLAWLALDRLRAESERASDDLVLSRMEAPSAYAQDLVSMARALKHDGELPRAALAMASPSGMAARVRAILDPGQRRGRVGKPVVMIVALVALAFVSALTVLTPVVDAQEIRDADPTPTSPRAVDMRPESVALPRSVEVRSPDEGAPSRNQERLCVFRGSGSRSTSMNVDDDEIRIRWETDDCRVDIDIEGDVEFAADDTDIVAMEPGALFEIEERMGRSRRRARLETGSGGAIERRYWVDGDEVSWNAEARAWLSAILPEIFRHSTINAEARVGRMLDEGGPDRVFQEVALIESDHVSRRYLELMMELGQLDDSDYERIIEAAGSIDSDHGAATLLLAVIEEAGLRPAFQDPLIRAAEGIDSDHQRTQVLEALLDSPLSPDQLDAVLLSASSIDSDHNLGQLLSEIARDGRLDDAGRASFLEALRSIDSDHNHGQVVDAFLDAGPLTDAELARILDMTEGIGSDHVRGGILRRIAEEYPLTGPQVTAYLRSASRLGSDHETAQTARAVIAGADFDGEQMRLVLQMADGVGSDHNRGEILQALVRRRDLGPDEVAELLAVARGIGSDHQLGQTLSALIDEQDLDSGSVEAVLSTLTGVGADHQRATVMLRLAERFAVEGRARALYEDLADDMGRHDRERVLAAISR